MPGQKIAHRTYLDALKSREALKEKIVNDFGRNSFLLTPTVSIIPPTLQELESEEGYRRINRQVLRTTAIANCIDGTAISLPIDADRGAPVGLMLTGAHGADLEIIALAARIESILS